MRLGIVAPVNFVDAPFGGTLTFIRQFLASGAIPEHWNVHLIGVTSTDDVPAREFTGHYDGHAATFLGVATITDRELLPLRARFYVGLRRCRGLLSELECDVYYAHTPDAGHAMSRVCPRIPLVLHRHGLASMVKRSRHWYGRLAPVHMAFDHFITRAAEVSATRILVTADQASFKDWAREARSNIADRASLIPAMVDAVQFAPRVGPVTAGKTLALVAVGRLEEVKGFDFVIKGLASIRARGVEADLSVVGSGSQETRLKRLAREIGVEQYVTFAGYLPPARLADVLGRADIYVSGSHQEGFSIALLEAMASGLPCVVTNTSGVRDVVVSGVNGWILETRGPDEIAGACHRVQEAGAAMKKAARSSALRFSARAVSEQIVGHLAEVGALHIGAAAVGSPSVSRDVARRSAKAGLR